MTKTIPEPPLVVGLVEPGEDWEPFHVVEETRHMGPNDVVRRWMFMEGHETGAVVIEAVDAQGRPSAPQNNWVVVGITDGPCVIFQPVNPPIPFDPALHLYCYDMPSLSGPSLADQRRVLVRRIMTEG